MALTRAEIRPFGVGMKIQARLRDQARAAGYELRLNPVVGGRGWELQLWRGAETVYVEQLRDFPAALIASEAALQWLVSSEGV